ncbi:MAG TPA: phenylalanine--tRNA ligase beta subunit-related protein [Kofleriaceae bacterium]|nr:phenylalanine--tRNA ligase beta subunit-related protein [Kofleriaceae bacterium]
MPLTITVDPHPLLEPAAFVTRTGRPISELPTPAAVAELATREARAPLAASDAVRTAVRDLLRHGGFKPAGRSKPAPEYLTGAFAEDRFPRINALVDTCNVVSLHTGLPISLVDVDLLEGELAIRVAAPGTSYAFNPAGQVIDAGGLLCLYDAHGPSGSPVKDAQRTKTGGDTRCALSIVWGTRALAGRTEAAVRWYRELVAQIEGAELEEVALV